MEFDTMFFFSSATTRERCCFLGKRGRLLGPWLLSNRSRRVRVLRLVEIKGGDYAGRVFLNLRGRRGHMLFPVCSRRLT